MPPLLRFLHASSLAFTSIFSGPESVDIRHVPSSARIPSHPLGIPPRCLPSVVAAYNPCPRADLRSVVVTAMSSTNEDAHGNPDTTADDSVTVLGFGSLLSESSSRLTFPDLLNFRMGRVPNHRRVFAHPASIFFQRGIADLKTLEMSSLSAEVAEGHSFVCSVFEVPNAVVGEGGERSFLGEGGAPSRAFLEREEEFEIATGVPFVELDAAGDAEGDAGAGILCRRSTDEVYIEQWGEEHFRNQYLQYGVATIWNWDRKSGLRPCAAYLRHCVLASRNCGSLCADSFLDETYLVDRTTTIREYLEEHPDVMKQLPPPELAERYGG